MGNSLSGPPETTKFKVGQWVMVRRNGNMVGKMWLAQVTKAEYKLVDRGVTSDPVSGSANGDTWAAFYDVNFHDGGQGVAEEGWCKASDPPPGAPAAEPAPASAAEPAAEPGILTGLWNYLSGPPETTKFKVGQWVMVRRNGNMVGKMWLAQVTKAEYKLVDRGVTSDPVSGSANGDTWAAFYDVNFHDGGQGVAEEGWCKASDPPPGAPAAEPASEPTPQ